VSTEHAVAVEYLAGRCEVMASLTTQYTPVVLEAKPPEEFFGILVSSIIGQQLAVKAAATIEARLVAALQGMTPQGVTPQGMTPQSVLAVDTDYLREQGLSRSKASYIQGLARAFGSGELTGQMLAQADAEQVKKRLTALSGIGPWTAEMFLIFGLGHPDVWSPGDYGLKKAVEAHFGSEQDSSTIARRWSPYRSYAALYLWEYVDQGPPWSPA